MLRLPKLDGRGPLKEFSLITNDSNDTNFPIDGEIVPTTPFDGKLIILTNKPEHVIPVQLHTVLSGIPPVQDQPLTLLSAFAFVAADTSHIAPSFVVTVGDAVGDKVGFEVGKPLGQREGSPDGSDVGWLDGSPEGCSDGCPDGWLVGSDEGNVEG